MLLLLWRRPTADDDDGGIIDRNFRITKAVAVAVVYIRLDMLCVHNIISNKNKNKKKIKED